MIRVRLLDFYYYFAISLQLKRRSQIRIYLTLNTYFHIFIKFLSQHSLTKHNPSSAQSTLNLPET